MAEGGVHEVHPVSINPTDEPNNFIVWLDKHIGKPEECILLKCSLFMTMDPTTGLFERNLNQSDIDRSIRFDVALFVSLDDVKFKFQVFVDVEKCYETIKNNLEKRIFFITSGSKGQIIVPSLVANFEGVFGPNNRIYIFCGNTLMGQVEGVDSPSNLWALKFREHILMFSHQDNLFTRMVLNTADYFSTEAQRFDQNQHLNNALTYYQWAIRLYQRYGTMGPIKKITEIRDIERRINDIVHRDDPQMNDEGDNVGEACS